MAVRIKKVTEQDLQQGDLPEYLAFDVVADGVRIFRTEEIEKLQSITQVLTHDGDRLLLKADRNSQELDELQHLRIERHGGTLGLFVQEHSAGSFEMKTRCPMAALVQAVAHLTSPQQ